MQRSASNSDRIINISGSEQFSDRPAPVFGPTMGREYRNKSLDRLVLTLALQSLATQKHEKDQQ